jgi:hypothetical protein
MTRPHVGLAINMGDDRSPYVGLDPDPDHLDDPEHHIVLLTPEEALKVAELLTAVANSILSGFEQPLPDES